ncbi:MAG: hypothetical protein CVU91_08560 [Firmicutes bacterium HGW-Firmicutes-16]|nr:MAG: hypothetical protein CVU91_08560 [Firmicutes bacterium HGW-Firmicutes-16]
MGLKENFYQALRELLNGGGQVRSESEEKADCNSDLDSYSENQASSNQDDSKSYRNDFAASNVQTIEEPDSEDMTVSPNSNSGSEITSNSQVVSEPNGQYNQVGPFGKSVRISRPTNIGQADPSVLPVYFSQANMHNQSASGNAEEEMSIISKNTVVYGDIRSLADITINGKVRGNVDVLKDASMHGMLVGNLMCNNTRMEGSSVQGNVLSKGSTHIYSDSILLGNLRAQYSSIDGKIKGNIEVGSKTHLRQNAIVVGDISTNSIAVEEGANIKGYVDTAFHFEHSDTPFPDEIIIENDDLNPGNQEI